MLDLLQPFFPGEWRAYGEALKLLETPTTRPSIAESLTDPLQLNVILTAYAQHLRSPNEPRAVASDWLLRYLGVLLPPMVALISLLKRRVPADWNDMALTLRADGTPCEFAIRKIGVVAPETDAPTRYHQLISLHLQPLLSLLTAHSRVPRRILWGNVRRTFIGMFDHALRHFQRDLALATALRRDRHEILDEPLWSDGRRNPLFLHHRRIAVTHQGRERVMTLHANCCLAYRLHATGYCVACPLTKARRSHDA